MVGEQEFRKFIRIKENVPVRWKVEGWETIYYGEGVVRDLSEGGFLLEVDRSSMDMLDEVVLIVEPMDNTNSFLPQRAKRMWWKPMRTDEGWCLCGAQFLDPSPNLVNLIKDRVQNWFSKIAESANLNILNNYINGGKTRF